jgi:hypothetical protein
VGINPDDLTGQQQMLVNRLLKGELGKDVTVIGLPPDVQKALKQLPSKDKDYAHLRSANMASFGFTHDAESGKLVAIDAASVKVALKRDGSIRKGDYLDLVTEGIETAGRKDGQGNQKDLENAVIEGRLDQLMPQPHAVHGMGRIVNDTTDATMAVYKAAGSGAVRKQVMQGTTSVEQILRDEGHGGTLDATKQIVAQDKIEKQREARRVEQVEPPIKPAKPTRAKLRIQRGEIAPPQQGVLKEASPKAPPEQLTKHEAPQVDQSEVIDPSLAQQPTRQRGRRVNRSDMN